MIRCGKLWLEDNVLTQPSPYQTHSNFEHLCMMEVILGPIPRSLLEGSKKARYFNSASQVNIDWNSSEGRTILRTCKPLRVRTHFDYLPLYETLGKPRKLTSHLPLPDVLLIRF